MNLRLHSQPCHLGDDVIRRLERRNLVHARVTALKARVRRHAFAQREALRADYGIGQRAGGLVGAPLPAPSPWFRPGHWSRRVGLAAAWVLVAAQYAFVVYLLAVGLGRL